MSTLERIQYGFDRDSRRTWKRRALTTNEDDHYGYDGLSQVINAARGNLNLNTTAISGRPANEELWNYDPTGNWQGYNVSANGAPVLDQSRVHDRGNRLTQIEDNPNAMILDRAGRMRQMSPDAGGDWNGKLELTWDAWSRITSVKNNGTVVGTYEYDGLTRRTTRTVGSVKTHTYYNDVWRPLEERKNALTTASAHYLWGARHRDDLVRRDRVTSGTLFNETRYVLMDYFSPAAITDAAGTVTERYSFSAFGVRRILAPDWSSRTTSECGFEFGFQGQFLDVESGLVNYGFRYYSPGLGRWMCKDPIGELGGSNLYAIVDNGVTNSVDFFGLAADCDCKNGLPKVRDDYGKKCCKENRAKDKLGREKCKDSDKEKKEKRERSGVSQQMCCSICKTLTYEAVHGTGATARRFGNTVGDKTLDTWNSNKIPDQVIGGKHLDVDWFTDLSGWAPDGMVGQTYVLAKNFWREYMSYTNSGHINPPWASAGERNAVDAVNAGKSYADIFNESWKNSSGCDCSDPC